MNEKKFAWTSTQCSFHILAKRKSGVFCLRKCRHYASIYKKKQIEKKKLDRSNKSNEKKKIDGQKNDKKTTTSNDFKKEKKKKKQISNQI